MVVVWIVVGFKTGFSSSRVAAGWRLVSFGVLWNIGRDVLWFFRFSSGRWIGRLRLVVSFSSGWRPEAAGRWLFVGVSFRFRLGFGSGFFGRDFFPFFRIVGFSAVVLIDLERGVTNFLSYEARFLKAELFEDWVY